MQHSQSSSLQGDKTKKKKQRIKKRLMYTYLPHMNMLFFGVVSFATMLQQCFMSQCLFQHIFNTAFATPFSITLLQHRFYASILQQRLIMLRCYNNIKLLCCSNTWFLIIPNHLTIVLLFWLLSNFGYNNAPPFLQTTMARFEWQSCLRFLVGWR